MCADQLSERCLNGRFRLRVKGLICLRRWYVNILLCGNHEFLELILIIIHWVQSEVPI